MNIVVPLDLTDRQAKMLLCLYEVLIDSFIDFYTALQREYPLADFEPDEADVVDLLSS